MSLRSKLLAGGATAAIAVVVAALAVWFLLFKSDAPPPVSLAAAIEAVSTPAATASPIATSTAVASPTAASSADGSSVSAVAASDDLSGTWTLVQSTNSFVGYRVGENLAGIGSTTAVGRTTSVEGSLVYDGSSITSVEVTADLTALASDKSMRDSALRRQALETDTYPEATFVLTTPIAIDGARAEGETATQTVVGDLTLHGVTRSIEIEVQGVIQDGQLIVVGSTEIQFANFGIEQPRAPAVLSVDDHGTLELQLVFARVE